MSFSWEIYEFIVNIVEVLLAYKFLKIFFEKKIEHKLRLSIILFFQAVVIQIINIFCGTASYYGLIIMLIFNVFLYSLIYKRNLIELVLCVIIYFVLVCLIELITIAIIIPIFNITPDIVTKPTVYRVILVVLSRSIIYMFIVFIGKVKMEHKSLRKIYIYELTIISLVNLFFIFIVFNIYKQESFTKTNKIQIFLITIGIIIFTLVVLKLVDEIIKYSHKEIEWLMREREHERQTIYIKSMQELNHKLMAQRHDYNHHISCIYGLLEMNKLEELKEYSKKLVFNMQEINSIVNVDNSAIGALLNFKLTSAKEKNINLDIDVNIPECLNIDSTDISIILGNAIDNAIEACEKLENKFISIDIHMNKEHLIIKIANTMKEKPVKINEIYKTTKQNCEDHGFGIENIKYLVNKYDGLLKIQEEDNIFKINIAIRNCGY